MGFELNAYYVCIIVLWAGIIEFCQLKMRCGFVRVLGIYETGTKVKSPQTFETVVV